METARIKDALQPCPFGGECDCFVKVSLGLFEVDMNAVRACDLREQETVEI